MVVEVIITGEGRISAKMVNIFLNRRFVIYQAILFNPLYNLSVIGIFALLILLKTKEISEKRKRRYQEYCHNSSR